MEQLTVGRTAMVTSLKDVLVLKCDHVFTQRNTRLRKTMSCDMPRVLFVHIC